MAFESEFAAILREAMGNAPSIEEKNTPQQPSTVWTKGPYIPFFSAAIRWNPKTPMNPYPKIKRKSRPKISISTAPPTAADDNKEEVKLFCVGDLNETGQKRLWQFQQLGATINPQGFTQQDLKKSYRILAKQYHPDSQGPHANGKKFHVTCQIYKALCALIRQMENDH